MAVVITEEHMAVGDWTLDLDYTPEMHAELVYDGDNRNPRKVHVLVYDPAGDLAYTGVLLRVEGDERGLTIGGRSVLWYLGAGDIGPMIVDREYVSGADKLGNGPFALDDLYWRRPSEGSLWTFGGGFARCSGGLDRDDVLESDEKFPTRPGQSYGVLASGVTGTGIMRVRTIYDGKFHPIEQLFNADLAAGSSGWTVSGVASIVNDPTHAFGSSGYVMVCGPIPKPQYIAEPSLEDGGASWTDVSDHPADMDIVHDPSHARDGGYVMRCGPVTQFQLLKNADYGAGLDYWYSSSTDAEPHAGIFAPEIGGGVDGNDGIITEGWSTAGRTGPELIKYLRADKVLGGGVTAYDVTPGETFRVDAYVHGHPGTDGSSYLSIMIPHPTTPAGDLWVKSEEIFAPPHDDNRWTILAIDNLTIQANRVLLNALWEVHNHSLGYWSIDHFTVTRTRGNRAKIQYSTTLPVVPGTRYEIAASARSGDDLQVGNITVGAVLSGSGVDPQTVGADKGSTDYEWARVATEFTPQPDYTAARPFVSALDIIGAPVYVDQITLTKLDNNTASVTGSIWVPIPERTYRVRALVRSGPNLQRGNVRLQMHASGTGLPPYIVESSPMDGTHDVAKELSFDFICPSAYQLAWLAVVFTDIEGDTFYVGDLSIRDTDTSTYVFDALTFLDPTADDTYGDSTAPAGAETVRVALIAPAGTGSWTVDAVSLVRTGVTPATGTAIVDDLLHDPDTGQPLAVLPGTINCPEVIPYDWQLRNTTNRNALDRFCSVVSSPAREYRVNADRTIDVGTAEEVFTDHSPDSDSPIVLLPTDVDVEPLPTIGADVELRPTRVHVIGADRQTVSGRPFAIESTADVPGAAEVDYDMRPVNRTLVVTDGTVDHLGYAQALADDIADKQARPSLSLDVTLTGVATRPAFGVGDWIYAYHPEAGLESPDYPTTIEGETVFPRRVRVFTRKTECGPRWTFVLRRENGSTIPLPGVIPSSRDAVTLTVGDRRPDWQSGGVLPAGVEYLRDRASAPR